MSSLIDWGLAGSVASHVAGDPEPEAGGLDLAAVVAESEAAVRDYTTLDPRGGVPEPEWVSRRQWVAVNLASFERSLAPIEARLRPDGGLQARLEGPLGATVGRIAGVELGALVGYASRRVLGQFEYPILGHSAQPPRLLFVAPNIAAATSQLEAAPEAALRWIALHEVTHAVHFAAVPWLRDHLGGLAGELLEGSRLAVGPSDIAAAARRVIGSDPRRLLGDLASSDPLTLLASAEARPLIASVQATMAAIEGFAEHVMDAAAPLLDLDVAGLREGIERRRRDRGGLARLLSWLLGIELKLRQYREGKRFVDDVVEREGIAALNRAWDSPETLPSGAELADPSLWLARTGSAAVAA